MKTDNELIAEFMGREDYDTYEREKDSHDYHTSWDWLMPVIEAISKTPSLGDVEWPASGPLGIYSNIKYSIPNIEKTYKAVVEFIKWFNGR